MTERNSISAEASMDITMIVRVLLEDDERVIKCERFLRLKVHY